MVSLENGLQPHSGVTRLFSMRSVLLASLQSCGSGEADAWCKRALRVCSHPGMAYLTKGTFTLSEIERENYPSSGSSGGVSGGPRNMNCMRAPSAAIFFMTYFYRAGGGGPMSPSSDPLLYPTHFLEVYAICSV